MIKYDLSRMITRRKGSTALMPVIAEPIGIEKAVLRILNKYLDDIEDLALDVIIRSYNARLTADADESTFEALRRLVSTLTSSVNRMLRSMVELQVSQHTEKFTENARKAFGVSLKGIIRGDDLEDYIEAAGLRYAGLCKGMSDDLVRKIQMLTMNALINSKPTRVLTREIKQATGVSRSRARLIARDQTAKINSELNKVRHKQAGIDEYVWRTAQDERVRERHKRLEGKKYSYEERTGAEEGLPPGQPIQCRCIAQGVVVF